MVEMLRERYYTKRELMELFNLPERTVRRTLQRIKRTYPLISTSKRCGYKIATTKDDLQWVLSAIADNRCKAITILAGLKQLKAFADGCGEPVQLEIDF